MTISLCMIVKNEEKVLARCLDSVKNLVDEIIIVDTGSADKTREIARRYTPHVFDFQWIDDFSAARNFAFSKARCDYQMWLDADDILPRSEHAAFKALKKTLEPDVDVVTMKYHAGFDAEGRPTFTYNRERLLRRLSGFSWHDPVHEYVATSGKMVSSDIAIYHHGTGGLSDRNLKIYQKRLQNGEAFSPRATYYYARELAAHQEYEQAVRYFEKYLEQGKGWVEDNIFACLGLARCWRALGRPDKCRLALVRSFIYDLPRPELCCELGYTYKAAGDYTRAAYWFQSALNIPPGKVFGFSQPDYAGFIPHIELCVCYDRLGERQKAVQHNDMARAFKPNHPSVAANDLYFAPSLPFASKQE